MLSFLLAFVLDVAGSPTCAIILLFLGFFLLTGSIVRWVAEYKMSPGPGYQDSPFVRTVPKQSTEDEESYPDGYKLKKASDEQGSGEGPRPVKKVKKVKKVAKKEP